MNDMIIPALCFATIIGCVFFIIGLVIWRGYR
jgi:hypothetical protein